jgi:hypothetical protein
MLATGGSRKIFPSYHTEIARFDQIFFKNGTFDVNLVFTATLACTKGHFSSQKTALLVL